MLYHLPKLNTSSEASCSAGTHNSCTRPQNTQCPCTCTRLLCMHAVPCLWRCRQSCQQQAQLLKNRHSTRSKSSNTSACSLHAVPERLTAPGPAKQRQSYTSLHHTCSTTGHDGSGDSISESCSTHRPQCTLSRALHLLCSAAWPPTAVGAEHASCAHASHALTRPATSSHTATPQAHKKRVPAITWMHINGADAGA